jgi:hypothetical protein
MLRAANLKTDLRTLRRGDIVTVRSLAEILATLDADGKFDGMPFMPEMAPFCGMTLQVRRRAERTCVEGLGMRGLRDSVLLDGMRCDGSAHDGCQRGCLFFWKTAWLRPVGSLPEPRSARPNPAGAANPASDQGLAEASERSRRPYPPESPPLPIRNVSQLPTKKGDLFYCQSTELRHATSDSLPGKLRCHLHDLRIGELTLRRFAYVVWRAVANRTWRLLHGRAYYELTGQQKQTAPGELNLQPGEWVQVRTAAEIQATLDANGRNRGLSFDPEMLIHCGRRYRVATPLRKIIFEENAKMIELDNTVLLEGLTCQGICALNCPRANYFYWREIWLKRV